MVVLAPRVARAAPPDYDLTFDLGARSALARVELGENTGTTIVAEVFLVVGDASGRSLLERALPAFFNGRFVTRPDRAVSVYAFRDAPSYSRYCRETLGKPCVSEFGFYRPDLRRIVMNMGPGAGTLTHEIVHAIMDSDFPDAPLWLEEGIASLFEAPVFPGPSEIHGAKNWRLPKLLGALRAHPRREEARLDGVFGLTNDAFRAGDERLHYAVARYLCQWLDERELLWPFYRALRGGIASDPTGVRTFTAVTGSSPADSQETWERWVKRL